MRNLLRNKYVVSVLALLAVIFIVHSFRPSPGRVTARSPAATEAKLALEVEVEPDLAPTSDVLVPAPMPAGLDSGASDPADRHGSSDPFLRPGPGLETIHVAAEPAGETPRPRLQAISRQGARILAVIDREVVAEGDVVNGYQVVTIHEDLVELRPLHRPGELRLRLFADLASPGEAGTPRRPDPATETFSDAPSRRAMPPSVTPNTSQP